MVLLINQQHKQQREKLTLEQLLGQLGDTFYLVTRKQQVTKEECISFVNEARQKNMNDFNIAALIKSEQGFLSALMK